MSQDDRNNFGFYWPKASCNIISYTSLYVTYSVLHNIRKAFICTIIYRYKPTISPIKELSSFDTTTVRISNAKRLRSLLNSLKPHISKSFSRQLYPRLSLPGLPAYPATQSALPWPTGSIVPIHYLASTTIYAMPKRQSAYYHE
jgi:hypothetical protein